MTTRRNICEILLISAAFTFLMVAFGQLGCSKEPDPDELVLIQLKKAGSNLLKPHKIQFFLYFPTQIAADQAASRIREMGFEVEVEKGAKGEDWLCLADRTMIPELSAIQKITRDFGALAASLNGEYDGWEARIEK